jgi:hypothetical protein
MRWLDDNEAERGELNAMTPTPGIQLGPFSLERMVRAVEKVRDRLLRASAVLEQAGIPYAVIGGNAVAAWVARVDEAAVRNTQDVDVLLRRSDLDAAAAALTAAGFVRQEVLGVEMFLDGPQAHVRDAVHVFLAGEKVRPDYAFPAPDVAEADSTGKYRILNLDALVRMKLTSFRLKDQVHLQDLLGVGLIDANWLGRLPADLAARLQELLNNPNA